MLEPVCSGNALTLLRMQMVVAVLLRPWADSWCNCSVPVSCFSALLVLFLVVLYAHHDPMPSQTFSMSPAKV